jgi:uncharacterized membrane protein
MNKEQELKIRDILREGIKNSFIVDNKRGSLSKTKIIQEYTNIICNTCDQIINVFVDAEIEEDYKQSKRD